MKPEELVDKLRQALPDGLRSVVLYGSAAAGDHVGKRSDYNVLVVTASLGLKELKALCKPSRAWMRAGNPAPLLFTLDRLKRSADVFPIEILDIKQTHRILYGEEIVDKIDISHDNLRLELEHELKGKLIQLRERYLETAGRPRRVRELLVQSLSTFLVLFRGALRLYEESVPARKLDVLDALAAHIEFDPAVFREVDALRTGEKRISEVDSDELFERYLDTTEHIVDAVDSYIRSG